MSVSTPGNTVEPVGSALHRLHQRTGAQATTLLTLLHDPTLPGPRVVSQVRWGDVASIAAGTPAAQVGLAATHVPGARGMPWTPPDALLCALGFRSGDAVLGRSLVVQRHLLGVVVWKNADRRPKSASIARLAEPLYGHIHQRRAAAPRRRAGVVHMDGTPWMADSTRPLPSFVKQQTQRLAASDASYLCEYHDLLRVELSRVSTAAGDEAVAVQLTQLDPVQWSAFHSLTPTQRAIAVLCSEAASLDIVADLTSRSRETVKSHLKTVYMRLGIGSRAELRLCVQRALTGEAL